MPSRYLQDYIRKPLLLVVITIIVLALGCKTNYTTTIDHFVAVKNTTSLEHGRYLTFNMCAGCHYNGALGKFTGKPLEVIPKIAGRVYASNLTHSKRYGIPDLYSDAEFAYLIKTGITRDGRFMPYMLRPNISDRDINDIIVFLRSDDPSLAAGDTVSGYTHLNVMGRMGVRMVSHLQPYKTGTPEPQDKVAEGRYLVDVMGCFHCHSKKSTAINYLYPEKTKGYMVGGAKMKTAAGKVWGNNMTMDKETGIGNYTIAEFRKAVQQAIDRKGNKLRPPMEAFPLTDEQTDAIYAYLQTLPVKHHKVKGH